MAASFVVALVPAVSAADAQHTPEAAASAKVKKKIKKLNARVTQLQQQLEEVAKQPGPQGAQGPQGPPGPSSGAAGGDLSGTYPNPLIAPGVVGTPELSTSIPAARVTNSTNETVGDGGFPSLTFDGERYDTANMHSNTTDNSRLTAPVTGIYAITAQVQWDANTAGVREAYLMKNASTILAFDSTNPGAAFVSGTGQEVTTEVRLQAGDFVEAKVFQNSGGSRTVNANSGPAFEFSPEFSMTWLAPGP